MTQRSVSLSTIISNRRWQVNAHAPVHNFVWPSCVTTARVPSNAWRRAASARSIARHYSEAPALVASSSSSSSCEQRRTSERGGGRTRERVHWCLSPFLVLYRIATATISVWSAAIFARRCIRSYSCFDPTARGVIAASRNRRHSVRSCGDSAASCAAFPRRPLSVADAAT